LFLMVIHDCQLRVITVMFSRQWISINGVSLSIYRSVLRDS
jgi:hypothetical protein